MSSEFNISVKLGAEVTGQSSVKQLTSTLEDCLDKLAVGNQAVKDAAAKAKEEIAKTQTAASALAKDFSKSFQGDITTGLRKGLQDTEARLKALTADLRAMYAAKGQGDPSATLRAAIEQTERKIQSASRELSKFQELSGKSPANPNPVSPIPSGDGLGFGKLVGSITLANLATQAITGAMNTLKDAISSVVSEGIRLNEFLETSRLGIATSVSAQYNLVDAQGKLLTGADAYNAALKISEEQMKAIRIAGLETAATSEELVKSFQVALASGASQGITDLTKLRELTINITNAATAMGVAQSEVPTAIRAVISGRELEMTTIGKTLGLTGELIRSWQQQGTLVKNLEERLGAYTEGANKAASSWQVVKSNIEETFQVFSADVTSGLFEKLRDSANGALAGIFDTKNLGLSSSFSEIANQLRDVFSGVGTVISDLIAYGIEAAQKLNKFLQDNSDTIGDMKQGFKEIYVAIKEALKTIFDVVKALFNVKSETGEWKIIVNTVVIGLKGVALVVAGIADGVRLVGGVLIWLGGLIITALVYPFEKALEQMGQSLNAVKDGMGDSLIKVSKSLGQVGAKVRQVGADLLEPFANGTSAVQKVMQSFDDTGKVVEATDKKVKKLNATIGGVKFPKDKKEEQLAAAKAGAEALFQITKDRLAREQKELDYQLSQETISITKYYEERKKIQLAALADEISAKNLELQAVLPDDKHAKDRIKLQTEINLLKKKEGDIVLDNNRKSEEAVRALNAKVLEFQGQLEQITGAQTAETIAAQVAEKFRKVRGQFVQEFGADSAKVNLLDNLINLETTKAKFAAVQKQYQDTLTAMQLAENDIVAKRQANAISAPEADTQIVDLHKKTAQELENLLPLMREYAAILKDPAVSLSVEKLTQDLGAMTSATTEAGRTMAQDLESHFTTLFESIATGSKSASDAIRDFASSVVASIAKIMAQKLASQIMTAAFGGSEGGSAGFFSSLFMAEGGQVPGVGNTDSVPAMLMPGEFVIRKSAVRRLGTGFLELLNGVSSRNLTGRYADGGPVTSALAGASAGGSFTHNMQIGLDRGLILEVLESPEGTKVMAKQTGSNAKRFRSSLGIGR